MNESMYSGLTLAYIGDAYYEIYFRKYNASLGITKVNDLHKATIKYTRAEYQALASKYLIDNSLITDEELQVFKRGRNSNTNKTRKALSIADYNNATGLEALIGYLYLTGKDSRALEILDLIKDNVKM